MLADNSAHLVAAAARRREQTLARAEEVLERAERTGDPFTVTGLTAQAGVSRSWLYTQPELLARLRQLAGRRPTEPPSAASPTERASDASLRRRLELAHQRNQLLQAEVHDLRHQLARALGERRIAQRQDGRHGASVNRAGSPEPSRGAP